MVSQSLLQAGRAPASAVQRSRHCYAPRGNCCKILAAQAPSTPAAAAAADACGASRRDVLLAAVVGLAAAQQLGPRAALAEEESLATLPADVEAIAAEAAAAAGTVTVSADECLQGTCAGFKALRDDTLAYEFAYPVATSDGMELPMALSRRPERYSSAAPLSADARQRIVCELIDLRDAVTVSISVGPPSGALRSVPTAKWKPLALAKAVLVDRSTARVTTGQRVSLSSVEAATAEVRGDGGTYYVYEHVSQGAPRLGANDALETFRHSFAVSAVRPGLGGDPFIYTLNCSCPEELWPQMERGFRAAVGSFRLMPPGKNYVAPDKDPWRFF